MAFAGLAGQVRKRLRSDDRGANLATDVDLEAGAHGGARGRHVGEADPDPERGRERAARHDAATDDGVALTGDPGPVERERGQPLGRAGVAHRAHGVGADEAVTSLQHHPSPASIGPRAGERSLP